MSDEQVYLSGELYLSLETVAEVYRVRTVWLREIYDLGLLESGTAHGPTIRIAATELDRVATIVRLHEVLGLDSEAIALML